MPSLFQKIAEQHKQQREITQLGNWFQCIAAIVADNNDPERQHRIRVKLPYMDEEDVHDEWIRQMGLHSGARGYGSFYIPKIGQEVLLFSEFGEGENLFYMCVYNEDYDVPGDCPDETVTGERTDCDRRIIAEGDIYIRGGSITLESEFGAIKIISPAGVFTLTTRE